MRRQTWNGAPSGSRFQGLGPFWGPLGELAKQVSTGAVPLSGTRPLAPDGSRPPGGIWSVGLHLGETDGRKEKAHLPLTLLPPDVGFASTSSMKRESKPRNLQMSRFK